MENIVDFLCKYRSITKTRIAELTGVSVRDIEKADNSSFISLGYARIMAGFFHVSLDTIANNKLSIIKYCEPDRIVLSKDESELLSFVHAAGKPYKVLAVYKNEFGEWKRQVVRESEER